MKRNNWEESLVRYFARFGEGRDLDEAMMRPLIVKWAGWAGRVVTDDRAAELARDAERRKAGLVDRFADHRKRLLAEHVEDWKQALAANGIDPFNP